MHWGFPWIHFWRQCLAVCPSPAGCNQYFILGTDVVGVSSSPMHQWRWIGSVQPVTTVPDHPGRAQWGAPRLGGKTGKLLNGLPTLCLPSHMFMHSKPAGSHLQARESNFESNASTAFGINFAVSIQIPAPGLEAWAVPGLSQVQAGCQGHQAATGLRPRSCCLCRLGCTTREVNQHHCDAQSWERWLLLGELRGCWVWGKATSKSHSCSLLVSTPVCFQHFQRRKN